VCTDIIVHGHKDSITALAWSTHNTKNLGSKLFYLQGEQTFPGASGANKTNALW
jgi:hypothetical protein